MQTPKNGDKLTVKNGWLTRPICKRNHRLKRILPDTSGHSIVEYCRTCHSEVILDIEKGQSVKRQSQ